MIGVVVNSTYDDKIGLMDDAATVKIGLDDIVFDAQALQHLDSSSDDAAIACLPEQRVPVHRVPSHWMHGHCVFQHCMSEHCVPKQRVPADCVPEPCVSEHCVPACLSTA